MCRPFFIVVNIIIAYATAFGGETVVKGKITDLSTGEPLPFVNIIFDKTTIGTVSDTAGVYNITAREPVDVLRFLALGYHPVLLNVVSGEINNLDVRMEPATIALGEVVAKPDNGPAHRLMMQVANNRHVNNPENHERYAYRRYSRWDYRINNVTDNVKQWRIFNGNEEMFRYDADGKRFLPVYFSEQVVYNEFQREPIRRKSTIEADRTTGLGLLGESEISGFTSGLESGVNFYENSIEILGQNFISPAANNGWFYYNYYLLDSVNVGDDKHYVVRFTPRRKGDNAFTGQLTVEDRFFSIVEVDANLVNTEHLNFIRSLRMRSGYQLLGDSIPFYKWSEVTSAIDYMPVDLRKERERVELLSVHTMYFSDIDIQRESEVRLSHRRLSYESARLRNYNHRDDSYWMNVRPDSANSEEFAFRNSIDLMNELPTVKLLDNIGRMTLSGYLDLGKLELGPYDYILNFNKVEGTHLFFGGRTSVELFSDFCIWGGVGYGTRNEQWLGRLGAGYMLPVARRNILQAEYADDIVLIGENENILLLYENKQHTSESNLVSHIFKRADLDELYRRQRFRTFWQMEVLTGFNLSTTVSWSKYHTPEFYPFSINGSGVDDFESKELTFQFRWSWQERYMDYGFRRLYLGTAKPIVNLLLKGGHVSVGREETFYGRIHSSYKHYLYLGQTRMDYALEGGAIFGAVPYPLLDIPRANETYGFQSYNFNMMNNLEFAHDRYLHLFLEYRLNGFLFKRTPLIRSLGLREVVSLKTMAGSLSERHLRMLDFPVVLETYNNEPYAEAGIGVENILRFFRIDAVWRLSDSGNAPTFGLRGRMELKF